MSVPIVVDEWLLHDLQGENGDKNQEDTLRFLVKLLQICDRIVILEDSPFQEKTKALIKRSENDFALRGISQFLHSSFILNASKTLLVGRDEIKPLPQHIAKLVPADDQYLFQTHLKVNGSFILTTDGRWPEALLKKKTLDILIQNPFL